jgi:hypothetical protein
VTTTLSALETQKRRFLSLIGLDYFGDMCIAVTNVLLLQRRGLSSGEIFEVIAAVWILEAILEVPTGIFADVVGRRVAVTISFVARGLGYSALFFFHAPAIAVAGVLTSAVGGTFASGAIEAWAVDELRLNETPGALDRFFDHSKAAESAGLFAGLIVGAVIGQVSSLAVPQVLAGAACLCGAFLILGLSDRTSGSDRAKCKAAPDHAAGVDDRQSADLAIADPVDAFAAEPEPPLPVGARLRPGYAEALRGLKVAIGDRKVGAILLLILGLFVCRGAPGAQWTVHFNGITAGNLVALAVARGLGDALQVPLLLRTAKLRSGSAVRRSESIMLFAVLAGAALVASALVPDGYLGLLLFTVWGLAWGLCMPGLKATLNARLQASSRATVLSFSSLLNSIGTGLVLAAMALAGVRIGAVAVTWTVSGLVAITIGLLGALSSWRTDSEESARA